MKLDPCIWRYYNQKNKEIVTMRLNEVQSKDKALEARQVKQITYISKFKEVVARRLGNLQAKG